jgi:hypothetical protein
MIDRKSCHKIQHTFIIKTKLKKLGIKRTYLNIKKAVYEKSITCFVLSGENHTVPPSEFWQRFKSMYWRKASSSTNRAGKTAYLHVEDWKCTLSLTLYQNQFKWITDLDVRPKTETATREHRKKLEDIGVGNYIFQ